MEDDDVMMIKVCLNCNKIYKKKPERIPCSCMRPVCACLVSLCLLLISSSAIN